MRRIAVAISRIVIASCLMLCAFSAYLWLRSTQKENHFSYQTSAARYVVTSSDGFITISGPPGEGTEDAADIDLATRMSNDDFAWGSPVRRNGKWYIEGDVRPGSATFAMFEKYSRKIVRVTGGVDRVDNLEFVGPDDPPPAMEAITRLWLNALEDPHKAYPAHLMLCFVTDRWKIAHTRNDDFTDPYLILPTTPQSGTPILEESVELRRYWHERFDVNRFSIHYSALCAISLLIPLIRVAKPRHSRGIARWTFNASGLVSLLLCIVLVGVWIDSYRQGRLSRHGREWRLYAKRVAGPFAPSMRTITGFAPTPLPSNWYTYRWLGWSKGRLQWLQRTTSLRPARTSDRDRMPYWVLDTAGQPQVKLRSGDFLKSSVVFYLDSPKVLAPGARSGSGPLPFANVPMPIAPPPTRWPSTTWTVQPLPVPASQQQIPAGVLKTDPTSPEFIAESQSVIIKSGGAQVVVDIPRNSTTSLAQRNLQQAAMAAASLAQTQNAALIGSALMPQTIAGTGTLIVSFWVPVTLTALLPLLWVLIPLTRQFRGAVRRSRHLCPNCSYDVRATPDRCPECGMDLTAAEKKLSPQSSD